MTPIGKFNSTDRIVRLKSLFRSKVVGLVYQAARYFQPYGITCLIEPLSTRANYYLRSYSTAIDIVKSSQLDNLKIMLDSFHLQRLHGNLTERVQVIDRLFCIKNSENSAFCSPKEMSSYVGHVQISQTPERDCPMNMNGEVNHRYFLSKVVAPFYQDYIGLEYNGENDTPRKHIDHSGIILLDSTQGSFEWLNEFESSSD